MEEDDPRVENSRTPLLLVVAWPASSWAFELAVPIVAVTAARPALARSAFTGARAALISSVSICCGVVLCAAAFAAVFPAVDAAVTVTLKVGRPSTLIEKV
jgi:hypothetical protein